MTSQRDKGRNRKEKRGTLSVLFISLIALWIAGSVSVHAQAFQVRGGSQTLNVTTAIAGSDPTPVMNSNGSLRYGGQAAVSKITVQTSCPGQKFNLTVYASGMNKGVAAPTVSLQNGMAAVDFIVNIPANFPGNVNATLNYTAAPLFSQGTGTDTHSVTYTHQAQ